MNLRNSLWVLLLGVLIISCSRSIDERAARGDAEAQRLLGIAYEYGDSLHKQNMDTAFMWYEKAALQGDTIALPRMIKAYYDGAYIPRDVNKAFRLAQMGDSLDIAEAQYYMSIFYDKAIVVPGDRVKALEYKQNSAKKGCPNGISALAYNYLHGIMVQKDVAKAIEMYTQAAEMGNVEALTQLADIYDSDGTNKNFADVTKHEYYKKKRVEKLTELYEKGDYNAAVDLAWTYIGTEDAKKGEELLLKIAETTGYYRAIGDYGRLFMLDPRWTKIPGDFDKAAEWLQRAADLDYDDAMWALAMLMRSGFGTPLDNEGALKLILRGGEMGNLMAIDELVGCYANSGFYGTPRDDAKAFAWALEGAKLDDSYKQNLVGMWYEMGKGVEQDYEQAEYWFKRAAQNGNENAIRNLQKYEGD